MTVGTETMIRCSYHQHPQASSLSFCDILCMFGSNTGATFTAWFAVHRNGAVQLRLDLVGSGPANQDSLGDPWLSKPPQTSPNFTRKARKVVIHHQTGTLTVNIDLPLVMVNSRTNEPTLVDAVIVRPFAACKPGNLEVP